MDNSKRALKLSKNTILFFTGSIASKLLTYILIPFYTSVLTTEEYGFSDTIFTTVNLVYPILSLLISEAVFRFALDQNVEKRQTLSIGILITLASSFIMLIFSPLIFLINGYSPYYIHCVLYYFLIALYALISQFVKGIGESVKYTISGVLGTLSTLVLTIVFIRFFNMGVKGYLWSYIISNFIMCLFLFFSCNLSNFIISFRNINMMQAKEMVRYSLPIIPNSISWWISTSSDKYIINMTLGYSVTGIYSIAYKIPSLMTTITAVFLSAWQISAVDDFGSSESKQFYSRVYEYFSTLLIIFVSSIVLLSKILSKLLFSAEFFEAWIYVPILSLAYLFHDLSSFLGSIYISAKKTGMMFTSTLWAALSNIVLNICLIPNFGAMGAAIATLASYFLVWLIRIVNTRKLINFEIKHMENFVCFSLLLVQSIIIIMDIHYGFFSSLLLLVIITVIKVKTIKQAFFDVFNVMKSIRKRFSHKYLI